jgi:trans-2,3-dihydro-3-hydroxyanthranilate isomerase
MLAGHGELGDVGQVHAATFEEQAGHVPIAIERRPGGRFYCELKAPQGLSLGATVPAAAVAAAAQLAEADVVVTTHPPQAGSVGLEFLLAEVRDRAALARARPDVSALDRLASPDFGLPYLHLYTRDGDGFDLRTRQFSSSDPLLEDPATGSANAALAGLLAHHHPLASGEFRWRIAQGVEMGRPSVLEARAGKRDGRVTDIWIGGEVVPVTEGFLEV